MLPEEQTSKPEKPAEYLARKMLTLNPGALAELRRMDVHGAGASVFWRLASECGFIEDEGRTKAWMQIAKIMAILTPKGQRDGRHKLHDPKRPFGAVLCDGGDKDRHGSSLPVMSEPRFLRFLAQRAEQRFDVLERIARMIAAKRKPDEGVDCAELANLLLYPNSEYQKQKIARAYYKRLDAGHQELQEGNDE